MRDSFLFFAGGRYFWIAALLVVVCSLLYIFDDPNRPKDGGTALGLMLGTLGALMIVWLTYLGRRKRNFLRGWGTVRGWVSAHVYLGTSLLVIATLHTGFQFGMNIHTLSYVLMCAVIVSGLYGVFAYRTYPAARNELKNSKTLDEVFLQLEEVDSQLARLSVRASNAVRAVATSAIERTAIGGGFFDQILGRDRSMVLIANSAEANKDQQRALDFLVAQATEVHGEEATTLGEIVRLFGSRKRLLGVIREDIRMHALVQVWLLFHVPVTFALLAALIAHIVSVFLYR